VQALVERGNVQSQEVAKSLSASASDTSNQRRIEPHGFPWFMQEQAYNFCHIFAGGELPSKPDE